MIEIIDGNEEKKDYKYGFTEYSDYSDGEFESFFMMTEEIVIDSGSI